MKKRMMVLILVAVVVYILVGRDAGIKYRLGQDLQLDLFWGKITTYFDNHAHVWHNDGATVAVLRFSEKNAKRLEESLEQSIVWSRTPMSEEFYYVAYERSHTWAEPKLFVDIVKELMEQNTIKIDGAFNRTSSNIHRASEYHIIVK